MSLCRIFLPPLGSDDRGGPLCVSFAYHMWSGRNKMGSLVMFQERMGLSSMLWNKSGNQGNTWYSEKVTVVMTTGDKVCDWRCSFIYLA